MAGTKSFDNYFKAWQEELTGYATNITSDHSYIHKGFGYKAILVKTAQSADIKIGFTTPASGKDIHWRPANIRTSADNVTLIVYEGDAFTDGTDITPVCLNRKIDNTSEMQAFKEGVTVTPSGTIIQALATGGGSGGDATGGTASSGEERLLKQDTDYVAVISPDGSTDIYLEFFWYEEAEH